MGEYIDRLVSELSAIGIEPSNSVTKQDIKQAEHDRFNEEVIDRIEKTTNVKFSDEQRDILRHKGSACILACAGSGKALANYEPVYTERGWVPIGKLVMTDKVFGTDGRLHNILGIFPQGELSVCTCRFSNGDSVDCNIEHLWSYRKINKMTGLWVQKTDTLADIVSAYRKDNETVINFDNTIAIEPISPLVGNKSIEIDCTGFEEYIYNYISTPKLTDTNNYEIEQIRNKFDTIVVSNIAKKSRLNIVRCLMSAYKRVEVAFRDLPCDVVEMFREVLGTLGISGYNNKSSLSALVSDQKLEAYLEQIEKQCVYYKYTTYLESVEITDVKVPMTCISVDTPDHLYITRGFIPTHNTTISVNLILKRIMTGEINPDKLLFSTYSKAGTEEMKERINKLLKAMGLNRSVQVRTLHSFFLSVLRDFGVSNSIIKDSQRLRFIREACKDAKYVLHDDSLTQIDTLLSYQVNNMLNDQETVESYVNSLDDLSLNQYKIIRSGYASRKASERLIDYDDMQSYLYVWLVRYAKSTNPVEYQTCLRARDYCRALYDYFFIDEAQDISKIQYEIIKAIVTPITNPNKLDKTLILVGDDDQCIYQWRGSDPSIILSIGPKFDIKTFVLSTNYRCHSAIVDYATTGVKCNASRYDKSMNAYKTGGDVKIAVAEKDDLLTMSTMALNHIKYWIANGERESEIAVLCRNNFHLALLSSMLFKEGIPCTMTDDMKLTKSIYFKDIEAILNIVDYGGDALEVGAVLWKMCSYMKVVTSKEVGNFMNTTGLDFVQSIGYILKYMCGADIDYELTINIPSKAKMAMQYKLGRMQIETIEDLTKIYLALTSNSTIEEKFRWLLLIYCKSTSAFIYKLQDKQRSVIGISAYLVQIAKESGFSGLKDFLRYSKQYENSSAVILGEPVTLVTEHSSKGREWKNVIMFACDNVSQPSLENIQKFVRDDIPMEDIYSNIDEERRLHYVGNTRAKNNLLVITSKDPSMFILESLGIIKENCNQQIFNMAIGGNMSIYRDDINKALMDNSSPYYYDKEKYKI